MDLCYSGSKGIENRKLGKLILINLVILLPGGLGTKWGAPLPSTSIEYDIKTRNYFDLIAGYTVHQYLKRSLPFRICHDLLTLDKEFLIDESFGPKYKPLQLSD